MKNPANFTRETAATVKVGDTVVPDPLWNQTERPVNRLPKLAVVNGIRHETCQTGHLFLVGKRWLDAGWFRRVE